jgi:hypothetical protein
MHVFVSAHRIPITIHKSKLSLTGRRHIWARFVSVFVMCESVNRACRIELIRIVRQRSLRDEESRRGFDKSLKLFTGVVSVIETV